MKNCTKCKKNKEKDQFNKKSRSKDGLRSSCRQCDLEYVAKNKIKKINYDRNRYKIKKEEIKKAQIEYYNKNKEKAKEKNNRWKSNNKERFDEYQKTYSEQHKEKIKLKCKKHYKNNKYLYTARSARRRALKKYAALKEFDQEIKEIYKNCPEGHHVDHIMPLNHPNLCGLHVPWNLQYLTAEENLKKSNKVIHEE